MPGTELGLGGGMRCKGVVLFLRASFVTWEMQIWEHIYILHNNFNIIIYLRTRCCGNSVRNNMFFRGNRKRFQRSQTLAYFLPYQNICALSFHLIHKFIRNYLISKKNINEYGPQNKGHTQEKFVFKFSILGHSRENLEF